MVAGGVDCHAGQAAASQQLLRKRLLGQVVDAHMVLRCHKKEGLPRVESHLHHAPPVLPEGILCCLL